MKNRDIAIAVRNIILFSDPAQMKPEVERINKQKALFIANRQALADIMKTDSTPAGGTPSDVSPTPKAPPLQPWIKAFSSGWPTLTSSQRFPHPGVTPGPG